MNRIVILVAILFFWTGINSCKTDSAEQSSAKEKEVQATPKSMNSELSQMRDRAKSTYDYRMEHESEHNAQILDNVVWEYEFTFANKEMSSPGALDGKWIDFNKNNTYEYGLFEQINGSGIYHYNPDKSILLMIDNDPTVKPHEYELRIVMNTMLMIGESTYNDKSTQSKLASRPDRPHRQ